jgi:hypothetical protein
MAKPNLEKLSSQRKQAFENLNINPRKRVILCLDGGGMRESLPFNCSKNWNKSPVFPVMNFLIW